ncbi:hypothetical protein CIL05_05735 [Virgibacillus profundi]|uniref:Oxidoreductase n=1 Tax=Virgibacillus profundi TaxID=2024555 RepID=A0A2A2IGE0_9BACI|nr:Gfo/Idh/MocA family oxidoreductase [Virgibacillus profundi]PAV30602.1 hypothetical protein CIL05_05735 [Virgibacillus profundi]PXY54774.1 gfo/Idh/MocA family oxidoreductase [Virgibacillus profundi]
MKFSTIGTSWITEAFIKAAQYSKIAELQSVYSRSEKSAKDFAERNGAKNATTDLDALLAEETDFIYIASPNGMHYEHILKCIENKKHVFSEKPMVLTEKQWKEVKELAEKQEVFVFEGFRHLFSPNYEILKKSLPDAGEIRSVMLQYVQYSSRYDKYKNGEEPNVFTKEFAGGALMDLGVYPLSMAIDLFGEPKAVDYFPVLLSNGIDGSGTLVMTYEGFIVTILCSKIAQGSIPSEIHGEDGALTIDRVAPIEKLSFYNRKSKKSKELAKDQLENDMVYELEAFTKMIEQKDIVSHDLWMERSRLVAKWSEQARRKQGILFPGE